MPTRTPAAMAPSRRTGLRPIPYAPRTFPSLLLALSLAALVACAEKPAGDEVASGPASELVEEIGAPGTDAGAGGPAGAASGVSEGEAQPFESPPDPRPEGTRRMAALLDQTVAGLDPAINPWLSRERAALLANQALPDDALQRLQQEIGLGDATAIAALEVTWPGSGLIQSFEGLEMDRFYTLREGDPAPAPVERPRIELPEPMMEPGMHQEGHDAEQGG